MNEPTMDAHRMVTVIEQVSEQARAAGRIALDTEFMGEGRYRTLLCLIQLAVANTPTPHDGGQTGAPHDGGQAGGSGERIEILDPLQGEFPGGPLASVLADPHIEIVVHAGRQDIALLRRALGCEAHNVFDTQVAAGFLGVGAQCSYDTLLAEFLGVRLAKSASFTRWDARPLSPEQVEYARDDVVHLTALALELQRRLEEVGRLGWAREECEFLEQVSDERDLDTVFERLPRVRSMNTVSQGVARELVAWRERTAAERDRPVQSVLGDAALVEIAKRKPTSSQKLEEIRGVGQNSLRKRGEELLAAIQQGLQRSHQPLTAGQRPTPPQPEDAPLIAFSEALVRARAREANLAYELLASRADLQAIVVARREQAQGRDSSGEADVRTLRGWRRGLVGEELLALLDGHVSLAVADGRLRVSST